MPRYEVSLTIKEHGRLIEERPLFDADEYEAIQDMVAEIDELVAEQDDEDEAESDTEE